MILYCLFRWLVESQLIAWVLSLWRAFGIDMFLSTSALLGTVSSHLLESLVVAPSFWVPETRRAIQALDRVRSLGFQSVSLPKLKEPPETQISTILPASRDRPWTKPNNVHSRRLWTLAPPWWKVSTSCMNLPVLSKIYFDRTSTWVVIIAFPPIEWDIELTYWR